MRGLGLFRGFGQPTGQPLGPKVKARPFNIRPEKVGLTFCPTTKIFYLENSLVR